MTAAPDADPLVDGEDERYHIAVYTSGLELRRVLKDGELFVVVGRTGNIQTSGRGDQGVYFRGTRHASRLVLRLASELPLLLGSSVLPDDLQMTFDLTNPDIYDGEASPVTSQQRRIAVAYGTIHVVRSSLPLDGAYLERVVVTNNGGTELDITLSLEFAADFADVFEVRGTQRERRGQTLPPELGESWARLRYRGLDDEIRATRFEFEPGPTRLTDDRADYHLRLARHGKQTVNVTVVPEQERGSFQGPLGFERAQEQRLRALHEAQARQCRVWTSSERVNRVLERARADLLMLQTHTPQGPYPYAGVPWYSTPFGRDGLWAAMQALWLAPHVGAGVLEFLSAHQATEHDAEADAEPGKIIHELREGEMAALREVPFGRYYGSIDSTPLYLMLAWRQLEATADRALMQRLWPNLLRAMEWIDVHGDRDGDGFVEYRRESADGLQQQGWKDSNDSVFHRDGTLATGSIALCEVQGYVYDAKQGMARVARALGQPELADRWEAQARELRLRFDAAFWCEELGTYALALDGSKNPCRVRTSNAGHCLFTDIALPERRVALERTLMGASMFSGHGIRTLAADEQRYNPISYHNGSVWPHDTGIVAAGLSKAGRTAAAERLLSALLEVAGALELQRLPELLCGFPRQTGRPPILYPVACSPQAWASGSVFMALQAVLGLRIDSMAGRITFDRPRLPPSITTLWITGLQVGSHRVSLRLHRHPEDVGILVTNATGDVEVVVVK